MYFYITQRRGNKEKNKTMTIFTKTQSHQVTGEYKETSIDINKSNADFLIKQMSPIYIKWNSGEAEIVSKSKLNKLQSTFTWLTDF